jgi:hypothetical protein
MPPRMPARRIFIRRKDEGRKKNRQPKKTPKAKCPSGSRRRTPREINLVRNAT